MVVSENVNTDSLKAKKVYGLHLGNAAPDITGLDFKDSTIKLSSLKGKLVLIDFWASWCGPCRKENPNVVKNYLEFKNKTFKNGEGFAIFSVSLDQKKESWINAVLKDNLIWPHHISDLKAWDSYFVNQYKITEVPTNYLINGDGIIIAKGLIGEALTKALEKNSIL